MKCAGMELGKWVSNSSLVADRSLTTTEVQGKGSNSTAKILGIHWDPEEDMLSYKVCLTTNPHNTKRQVLSDMARIFDPLGILSPVLVQFKILFQKLWLLDLGWDTELPPKIARFTRLPSTTLTRSTPGLSWQFARLQTSRLDRGKAASAALLTRLATGKIDVVLI